MAKEKPATKVCKHCKTEIDYTAKVCPQCRKKQGGSGCLIAIGVFVALALLGSCFGGNSSDSDTKETTTPRTESTGTTTQETTEATTTAEVPTEPAIEYTAYTVDVMMSELKENALKASDKYDKQYVEISGKLGTIDSSGKYITIMPIDDEWAFVGVQCYIKNDDQKNKVMEMTKGDPVTLRGKIKSVGEVLGYSLDIDEID